MAHHTGHTQRRRRTGTWCTGYIFGVGHTCHLRAQQGPQLLEFGSGVIASHLLAGDDCDRSSRSAQSAQDRMWITDARPGALEATTVIAAVAVDVDPGLLNILGQQ